MESISYCQIGVIRSPFTEEHGTPIQPSGARGIRGRIEMNPEFCEGLADLELFSHIILLYHFHRVGGCSLTVTPFLDTSPRGVFSTRAPCRPNPIGLSVVTLLGIDGAVLSIEDVDILDGTPLLDIKPYVPDFDHRDTEVVGWLSGKSRNSRHTKADGRFLSPNRR